MLSEVWESLLYSMVPSLDTGPRTVLAPLLFSPQKPSSSLFASFSPLLPLSPPVPLDMTHLRGCAYPFILGRLCGRKNNDPSKMSTS